MRNLSSAGRLIALPFLLLAVMGQAHAVVRSLVMRATPAFATPFCGGDMARHVATAGFNSDAKSPRGACPYCDVASHAPVFVASPPVPQCHAVAFFTFDSFASAPVREPPAILARARDPPTSPPDLTHRPRKRDDF